MLSQQCTQGCLRHWPIAQTDNRVNMPGQGSGIPQCIVGSGFWPSLPNLIQEPMASALMLERLQHDVAVVGSQRSAPIARLRETRSSTRGRYSRPASLWHTPCLFCRERGTRSRNVRLEEEQRAVRQSQVAGRWSTCASAAAAIPLQNSGKQYRRARAGLAQSPPEPALCRTW